MFDFAIPNFDNTASSMPFAVNLAEVMASVSSSSSVATQLAQLVTPTYKATTTQLSSLAPKGAIILIDNQPFVFVQKTAPHTDERSRVIAQTVILSVRLDQIKDRLGLSITQMAELFGVTRKSVYDWYEGAEPRNQTTTRIETLIDVLDTMPETIDLRRLKTVWNIAVSGQSFRAVFNDDNLDATSLRTDLKAKLNELSPRMVATTNPVHKKATPLGESHLSDIDRLADFG